MIDLDSVLFGTDAEVFLRTRAGTPIPVCGMVGGTKDKPRQLEGLPPGFCVQEDNAALEFNIAPTSSHSGFRDSVMLTLQQIGTMLPKSVYMDFDNSSMEFDEAYLQIPAMSTFGCEPDYNAWTLTTNDPPRPPKPGFRSAAGHIHVGWKDPNDEDRIEIIRLFDVFVALPNLINENESDKERRKLYGKAGAFRWKEYGVEHRVLSNSWLREPYNITSTLKRYADALGAFTYGVKVNPKDYTQIQSCINEGKLKEGLAIYANYAKVWEVSRPSHWDAKKFYQRWT